MRILILGSGGREHALAWRLARDPDVTDFLVAPGNPGIATICRCLPVDLARPDDVLALAARQQVDLTVVGPEAPLTLGLGDLFGRHGRALLGPTKVGAALEGSKVFAKQFMAQRGIPTARFVVASSAPVALEAIAGPTFGFPVVVKADGLAAGKGVVVAETRGEAEAAVRQAMVDQRFGEAGARLVIEECLVRPRDSCFFLCDGTTSLALSTAQDHKRILDGDLGPNTGGMGAFAPSPLVDDTLATFAAEQVVAPVLAGMREAGEPFVGFLYVSLMLTADGPKVIEFNVRFGDPEAQVVLPMLDGSLARALAGAAAGRLNGATLTTSADRYVGVVLASRGYPAGAESGRPIHGLEDAAAVPGALVFHAGTARDPDGRIVTAGGRVLTIVGRGADYTEAMTTAYRAVGCVNFEGMQFRRDIGRKALAGAGGPQR